MPVVMPEARGHNDIDAAIARADALRKDKQYVDAFQAYQDAIASIEVPPADVCVKIARCAMQFGDDEAALRWVTRVVDAPDSFTDWQAACMLLTKVTGRYTPPPPPTRRSARVAVLGTYTTSQLVQMLPLAALRFGVRLEMFEAPYAQHQQQILDPGSELYSFDPEFVIMATHAGAVNLPRYSATPEGAVAAEAGRWTALWEAFRSHSGARLVMHNIAVPPEAPMGHLSARVPGSRLSMLHRLNAELGAAAGNDVSIVDCERMASWLGKQRWFDDKYWFISKQAVALEAVPALAKHTAAVLAADLGLSRKCLVLDLDNTLWGGVIGEDGLAGIRLGEGTPEGEAYMTFQRYALELKAKGVILAVCSKNNDADAREPFEQHPDMQIKLDDIAMFVANWDPKPQNLERIAQTLNIGIDSLVFADDNPAEREVVRQMLPEVEVLFLPADPTLCPRALAECLWFETSSFTAEDARKTEQYRAKAKIAELESSATSLEDFYRSLDMEAVVAPFDELHLPRIMQLIGKTNQFNLTTRRHTQGIVEQLMADPACVHLYLKLRDRFTDHGLVSLIIARAEGGVLDIDTWLMSCRVIGRTVEAELLSHLCRGAERLGCTRLRGTYVPTAKNGMVKEVYAKFGFQLVSQSEDGTTVWEYDLAAGGPIENGFIARWEEDASDAA